jgi:hypothetical protein
MMGSRLPYPHRLQPLAARLSKACQLARQAGFKIVDGTYGAPAKKCMCPVGALYWSEGRALDLDYGMFAGEDDFVAGFDGGCEDEGASAEYKLGREFRKRFIRNKQ